MKPGRPSASPNCTFLAPFICLPPGSPWAAGKSGAAFLMNKISLAHKRRGEVGWTSLALFSQPLALGISPAPPRWHPPPILRGSEGAAKPLWATPPQLGAPGTKEVNSRIDEVAQRQGVLCGCPLLPFSRLGRRLREEARPAGSRERHRIQGEQQRKQTNRALCGCRLAAQKGSRLGGEGEGTGGPASALGRDRRLDEPRLGGQGARSATVCGQAPGVSLAESQPCHFSPSHIWAFWPTYSGRATHTRDWGDSHPTDWPGPVSASPHPAAEGAGQGGVRVCPGSCQLAGAWAAAEPRGSLCPAADGWRVGGQRPPALG